MALQSNDDVESNHTTRNVSDDMHTEPSHSSNNVKKNYTISDGQCHFKHPCQIAVFGASQTGKTHYVIDMLLHDWLTPAPEKVYICYHFYQPIYEQLKEKMHNVIMLDDQLINCESLNPFVRTLVIFDDLMTEVAHSKFVTKLFTGGSHHQNVTVISVLQNLFLRTEHSVT